MVIMPAISLSLVGFDEIQKFHHGTFDAVRGNFSAPSGRGSVRHHFQITERIFKMKKTTFWHMQMHPDDKQFADEHVYSILEHKKIIGLGNWREGEEHGTIDAFKNAMEVNDVVAIKNGGKLIALVQVIGGCYEAQEDDSEIGWIENRRPIRVLDWELDDKYLPQPMGTLNKCVNDVETTRVITGWHERVIKSFNKRKINLTV